MWVLAGPVKREAQRESSARAEHPANVWDRCCATTVVRPWLLAVHLPFWAPVVRSEELVPTQPESPRWASYRVPVLSSPVLLPVPTARTQVVVLSL